MWLAPAPEVPFGAVPAKKRCAPTVSAVTGMVVPDEAAPADGRAGKRPEEPGEGSAVDLTCLFSSAWMLSR
jgi:hypothetical protein